MLGYMEGKFGAGMLILVVLLPIHALKTMSHVWFCDHLCRW